MKRRKQYTFSQPFDFRPFWLLGITFIFFVVGLFGTSYAFWVAIALGFYKIIANSWKEIRGGHYSLDYIAALAIIVSFYSQNYIAGAIIAVMFTGSEALQVFAEKRAEASLRALSDTVPKKCVVVNGEKFDEVPIQNVHEGECILIKKNEVVPLDGTLISDEAFFNVANLTGESEPITLPEGAHIKSGSINVGDTIQILVVGDFSSSTYRQIIKLVEEAHAHPARIVRLSERANWYFTAVTLLFAGTAYLFSNEVSRALAVLVIATPCPLLIAAPVAFIGGMSRLAKSRIIVRKPIAFESIANADTIFFDKTGTLTLGEPRLQKIEIVGKGDNKRITENEALSIAAGIEIHSLHPLARTIFHEVKKRGIGFKSAEKVTERLGIGITGTTNGKEYSIKQAVYEGSGIVLSLLENKVEQVRFYFSDELKDNAKNLLLNLQRKGISLAIITGDKRINAEEVFTGLGLTLFTETTPLQKYALVEDAEKKGKKVLMVGDGLNDAPALARAHVGIVFSGTENGASIAAADVAILGNKLEKLLLLFAVSDKTVRIAKESIYTGIGLSLIGMIFAVAGYLKPIQGAIIQEAIDVIVILNALRTLRA